MPSISTGNLYLPSLDSVGVGSTAIAMSASTDYVSTMFQIPRTGTVTGVKFATSTVTTGATLTVTLETIVDSKPSGTLIDANATGTVVIANTDDSVIKTVSFAGNVSVTRGDFVCIKYAVSSGTPNALNMRIGVPQVSSGFPYNNNYIATTHAWAQGVCSFSLTYDDGDTTPMGIMMYRTNTNVSASSTTSPDELGLKFTAPYSAAVTGAYWRTTTAANAQDVDLILYDASDNVVASQSFSKENFETASSGLNNSVRLLFDADVNILKGRTYRLVLKPTTSTTWTNIFQTLSDVTVDWEGLANIAYTYRTDAGAWTDDSTRTIPAGLIISKIHQPGGSFL
jgi:hypothetical protein